MSERHQQKQLNFPHWRSAQTYETDQHELVRDRFIACLVGGAAGDALGAAVEFLSLAEIKQLYGEQGITEYAPIYGGVGRITDDTQMTLFTAEGLIRGHVRERFRGLTNYQACIGRAYLRWLKTQGLMTDDKNMLGMKYESGWLVNISALHSRRAPGNTCLSALTKLNDLGTAANNSKGCGGVMRVAPIGLFTWMIRGYCSLQDVFKLGKQAAELTHGHPSGYLTAGVMAVLIYAMIDGAELKDALVTAKAIAQSYEGADETINALNQAERLAATDLAPQAAIAQLGEGWVAEEALAIAVYCALKARDFRHAVELAVNHTGDSDSTGSIVGNLLGAQLGMHAIPDSWLIPLELKATIIELAGDLYDHFSWNFGEYSEDEVLNAQVLAKYPGS